MTRDVYAGDQGLSQAPSPVEGNRLARIVIRADALPDVLLRICAPLNLFNVPPERFLLRRDGDGQVHVEVTLKNCSEFSIDMVCRKLAQLTCVLDVERGA